MILNPEALEVLNYLKFLPGQFVPLGEIARRASGRKRFNEDPRWPRRWMSALVDAGLVEVNERGQYRAVGNSSSSTAPKPVANEIEGQRPVVGGDGHFPAPESGCVVGDDYFPSE